MLVLIAVAENRMLNLWGSCKGWDLTPHFTTYNLIMRFLEEILTLEIQAEALQAETRILFFHHILSVSKQSHAGNASLHAGVFKAWP